MFSVQLTPGGKAAEAGVGVGDWVVSIDDANAEEMNHVEAQNKIRAATDSLTLTLNKWVIGRLATRLATQLGTTPWPRQPFNLSQEAALLTTEPQSQP